MQSTYLKGMSRRVFGLLMAGAFGAASGCTSGSPSADQLTCADYLAMPDDDRGQIARTLGVEKGYQEAGSPFFVFNLDGACGKQQSGVKLADVVELFAD